MYVLDFRKKRGGNKGPQQNSRTRPNLTNSTERLDSPVPNHSGSGSSSSQSGKPSYANYASSSSSSRQSSYGRELLNPPPSQAQELLARLGQDKPASTML